MRVSFFGTFYRPKWQIFLPFHILLQLVKKGAPFWGSLPLKAIIGSTPPGIQLAFSVSVLFASHPSFTLR